MDGMVFASLQAFCTLAYCIPCPFLLGWKQKEVQRMQRLRKVLWCYVLMLSRRDVEELIAHAKALAMRMRNRDERR